LVVRTCLFHLRQDLLKAKKRLACPDDEYQRAYQLLMDMVYDRDLASDGALMQRVQRYLAEATHAAMREYVKNEIVARKELFAHAYHRDRLLTDDSDARTTNVAESWHNRLKKELLKGSVVRVDRLVETLTLDAVYANSVSRMGRVFEAAPLPSAKVSAELTRRFNRAVQLCLARHPHEVQHREDDLVACAVQSVSKPGVKRYVRFISRARRGDGEVQDAELPSPGFRDLTCTCDDPSPLPCVHMFIVGVYVVTPMSRWLHTARRTDAQVVVDDDDLAELDGLEPAAAAPDAPAGGSPVRPQRRPPGQEAVRLANVLRGVVEASSELSRDDLRYVAAEAQIVANTINEKYTKKPVGAMNIARAPNRRVQERQRQLLEDVDVRP
jgi:hypothetical protein